MENEPIVDTLREFLKAEPFVPFQITATNGRHYDVHDPLGVAVNRSQVFYCFPRSDRIAHIRMAEVVSVETLQAA